MKEGKNKQTNEKTNKRINEEMNKRINEDMNKQTNKRTKEHIGFFAFLHKFIARKCIASSRLVELLPFKSPSTYPTQFLTVLEIELFCNLIGTKVTPLDSLNRFSRSFYSSYNNNELCARLKYEDIIYFFPEKKSFFLQV